jgi:acetyltransferase-like isoleucine patch superfamily enzyme
VSGGKTEYERAPVKIGNCCYIGPQSVIAKGVSIGEHSVAGACSFINWDIPACSFVAGVPGKVIGKVVTKRYGEMNLSYQIQPK